MAYIHITGRPSQVSREELRAMAQASATVLEFHNLRLAHDATQIEILVSNKPYLAKRARKGNGRVVGQAWYGWRRIEVVGSLDHKLMFDTVLHETIHLYLKLDDDCCECCTSTLVGKFLPDVSKLYEVLVSGTYRRAAYLAHTKLSYRPKGADHYNHTYLPDAVIPEPGKKYRDKHIPDGV